MDFLYGRDFESWDDFGGRTGEGGGQGGASVRGSRLSGYEAAGGWVWDASSRVWVSFDWPVIMVGGSETRSYCCGSVQGSVFSSLRKMRFIPSISISDIVVRLHKDLYCQVCSTRRLVDWSKRVTITVLALRTS